MSDTMSSTPGDLTPEEVQSGLFAQLVLQQANLAAMLMGQEAHPETGKVTKDLDAARMFIDQLEMLEVKTRGNLNKEEAALLKQTLMNLRLGFVAAVESPARPAQSSAPAAQPEAPPAAASPPAAEEHPKKFSKKY